MQAHLGDTDRKANADIAFAGERLQRDRIVRTANKDVPADPETERGLPLIGTRAYPLAVEHAPEVEAL